MYCVLLESDIHRGVRGAKPPEKKMGIFVVKNEMRMSLGGRCRENFSLNQGGVINPLFSDLKFSLN